MAYGRRASVVFLARAAIALAILARGIVPLGAGELRTWTSADGRFTTQAELVEIKGDQVVLKQASGNAITVPISALSQTDRDFLTKPVPAKEAPKVEPPVAKGEPKAGTPAALIARVAAEDPPFAYEPVKEFSTAPQRRIDRIAVSRDETRVLTCCNDTAGTCFVWNLATGEKVSQLDRTGLLDRAALSKDGKIAVVTDRTKIEVFNALSGKLVRSDPMPDGAELKIEDLRISDDSQWYCAITHTRRVLRRGLTDGRTFASPPIAMRGDRGGPFTAIGPLARTILMDSGDPKPDLLFFRESPARMQSDPLPVAEKVFPTAAACSPNIWSIATDDLNYYFYINRGGKYQHFGPMDTRGSLIRQMVISSNEGIISLLGDANRVQIVDLFTNQNYFPLLPYPHLEKQIGPSGVSLFFAQGNKLCYWQAVLPKQGRAIWVHAVTTLFADKQYALLDELADECLADPERFPFTESPKFDSLIDNLDSPISMKGLGPLEFGQRQKQANEWLAKNPKSVAARVLVARFHVAEGWDARGSGFADTVTREGAEKFQASITAARETLAPVMESDNPPARAYSLWFTIAKAESWDGARLAPYLARFFKRYPTYHKGHALIAERLLPRWGGDEGETGRYIQSVGDQVGGEQGDIVYARLVADVHRYYSRTGFFEESGLDYDRTLRGLAALARDEFSRNFAANYGLYFAGLKRDREQALRFADLFEDTRFGWLRRPWRSDYAYENTLRWLDDGS
ncbi:SHD1 domain-containing protein [Lignipirellula cremea]|uniref:SLA1 homology domain-containing protein n=1 Tax=Lignipirellula cremea TaxID=2528010 RepID=A0A518DKX7_9BACT|nr:SHD1 domain-containing protein [Lignipirellula cremea]QDU92485.1 hypothetical protein Pla8534_02330 [Lignipirellula cremea]